MTRKELINALKDLSDSAEVTFCRLVKVSENGWKDQNMSIEDITVVQPHDGSVVIQLEDITS